MIYSRALGIIYIYCLWVIINGDDERVNNGIIFNLERVTAALRCRPLLVFALLLYYYPHFVLCPGHLFKT